MGGGEVLQVTHLITDRGRARILRDVSLTVCEHQVVCLVGRNGAGKTTTMDSLMGLLPVRGGAIRLHGQDITRLPAHARARRGIGYAPEDAGVFPDLTVDENLHIAQWLGAGGRPANGEGTDTGTARVFELFPELRGLRTRPALNLSGGEKKKVAIARAVLVRPAGVVLDEGVEGVAPPGVRP